MRSLQRGNKVQLALFAAALLLLTHAAVASPMMFVRTSLMLGSAAASLSAAVPANPYNTLAQELAEREADLDRKAAALTSEGGDAVSLSERLAPYSLAASGVLFLLVALNFYFDWRKRRKTPYQVTVH